MKRQEADQRLARLSLADADAFFAAGIEILKGDQPEALFPIARQAAAQHATDYRIHQLLGLVARVLGESGQAEVAFSRAATLAPTNPLIAHSHARATLEAGRDATHLFEHAIDLSPRDGAVLQGYAAALHAIGRPAEAMDALAAILEKNPLWTDGHRTLAHLRGQQGLDPAVAIERAITVAPEQAALRRLLVSIRLEARDLEGAAAAVQAAMRQFGEAGPFSMLAAHVASEAGNIAQADACFAKCSPDGVGEVAQWVRHLIRAGRPETAEQVMQSWEARDPENFLWPYRALAWRLLADPRGAWLEGDPKLVGVYDLADAIGDIPALVEHIGSLHVASAAPLDQSVRGGTQTDGNLLIRDEAPIRALRALILQTVNQHIAQLPPPEDGHPTLLSRRDPVRLAGSWSVRLRDAGFHTDHVHSQGWVSSALYLALPDPAPSGERSDRHAGWLTLGECRDLVPGMTPLRLVEPRPGRLVLFPSTMWHGTRAFPAGERLTVAFDIARPQQG